MRDLKARIRSFWEEKSCGEAYAAGESEKEYYESHARARYELEPYIRDFARFQEGKGKEVLEIGVGMGADHVEWAKSGPRSLVGIDLTPRAIEHTRKRLATQALGADVRLGDAENLPFPDASFDLVYSWGVLHHSPDTPKAVEEVFRVLRPAGTARIMIYHKHSLIGYMLWARYGLLAGRPFRSLNDVYAEHLESPGTKAYAREEARRMFKSFSRVSIRTQLSFGDLLQGGVGQRHAGMLLSAAKRVWPRWLLKRGFRECGLYLLIEATK
jgi:ubiquinone/menaquinone biosynthesis C-methylase UbiE